MELPVSKTLEYYDLFKFCEAFGRPRGSSEKTSDGARFLENAKGTLGFGNDIYIDFYHDAVIVDLNNEDVDPDVAAMQRIAQAMGWIDPENDYYEISVVFKVCW